MSPPQRSIAFLGPAGSFSHQASLKYFGEECNLLPVQGGNFIPILAEVAAGSASDALVPFYNSHHFGVLPVQSALQGYLGQLTVHGFCMMKIDHNVVVADGFESLVSVSTKKEVFKQCRTWIEKNNVQPIEADSTADALIKLLGSTTVVRKSAGAICSKFAVSIHGGTILEEDIHEPNNVTMFAIVSKEKPHLAGSNRILVCLPLPTEDSRASHLRAFEEQGYLLKGESAVGQWHSPLYLEFESSTGDHSFLDGLVVDGLQLAGAFPPKIGMSARFSVMQKISDGECDIGILDEADFRP